MSNQNNPYPEFNNQPLINNQNPPQVGNAYYPPQINNGGYVPPPTYTQGITHLNQEPTILHLLQIIIVMDKIQALYLLTKCLLATKDTFPTIKAIIPTKTKDTCLCQVD